LIDRLFKKNSSEITSTLLYPCSSVLFAYLYSLVNPSGTYGSVAYTQTNSAFLQIVSITGIWGIIFIIGWTAGVIVFVLDNFSQLQKVKRIVLCYLLLAGIILLYGEVKIHLMDRQDETVRIAGIVHDYEFNKSIKGNIPEFKLYSRSTEEKLFHQSETCIQSGAKIVFWQETAHVLLKEDEDSLVLRAKDFATQHQVYLGLSLLSITRSFPDEVSENKIIWITPAGKEGFRYLKAYPTPAENIIPGEKIAKTAETEFGKLSSVICFDLDFPSYIREFGKKQVNILTVPANDWREITPYHANISLFRAIENGFSIVRVTGKGLSVVFDANGREHGRLNYFASQNRTMIADVPIKRIATVYSYAGNFLAWISLVGILLIIFMAFKNKRQNAT
jgi:apolipoprotein N-acyltransferase